MSGFDFSTTRVYLSEFRFKAMFIEVLGWSVPKTIQPVSITTAGVQVNAVPISQLAGIVVFEVTCSDGTLPKPKDRAALHKEISKLYHENLLIFVDRERTQSLWYWVKRDGKKEVPRDHLYLRGQPGDLFLGKLSAMFVDMSELDEEGNINVVEVARRLQSALDVERVTKKFFNEFAAQRIQFLELIQGIADDHDRRWYASVLLNRLMFIYFLQKKAFVNNGEVDYLQRKLQESQNQGKDRYYQDFLKLLFFEGFAKPKEKRSQQALEQLGEIRYLSGSIFLPHPVELRWPNIQVPDEAFENLFALFGRYSWNLDDTPGGHDDEINPDVLGYIFEKYINQKAFGAYYTRPEITEYLCEKTIHQLILEAVNTPGAAGVLPAVHFESVPELLVNLDARLCRQLLFDVLPKLSLLDPACGSGAFLVAAMKTLINIYSAVTGRIEYLGDATLSLWLEKTRKEHPSLAYYIKRRIISDNLFGVDIMEEASEITRVRLFLALVSSAQKVEHLEPLPNIDFNILSGNSLIGLLRVDEEAFNQKLNPSAQPKQGHLIPTMTQPNLLQKSYRQLVAEKQRMLETYRGTLQFSEDLQFLRDEIEDSRTDAYRSLNDLLLNEFSRLGIKYEEAVWDEKKNQEGKRIKRGVHLEDVAALRPFHWGYEFDEVMNGRGGFDAVITNPPWETFQPNGKEFFSKYSDRVSKKTMTVAEFNLEVSRLLKNPIIRKDWFTYESSFPYQREYFRFAQQYKNQVPIINNKRHGKDVNLFKLFVEQCFNLLRPGGLCGIVVPSGIYSDLGTRQLREVLFNQTQITGLFGFENRKAIFEGVDSRFKFVVLTFEKGGVTKQFPAAFMRHEVSDLSVFPQRGAMWISVDLIRRLSPESSSVMEFKNDIDISIVEKMLKFPLLGEQIEGAWLLELHREFNMTDDASIFTNQPQTGFLPLYEGKMIHHFTHLFSEPRFWIDNEIGRRTLLGRDRDTGQVLGFQKYRLAYRSIASNTNERSLISTVIPPCFTGNSLNISESLGYPELLFCTSLLNSFVVDWMLRLKVTTNINMFYIYQLPVPRLSSGDLYFEPIVRRAAQLICTAPEYDALAQAVGLRGYAEGVTDPAQRAQLRAELDGLAAHLYGLSEEEFAHILSTFPLVDEAVKQAALDEFRKLTPDGGLA